jgi:hypothetical protein
MVWSPLIGWGRGPDRSVGMPQLGRRYAPIKPRRSVRVGVAGRTTGTGHAGYRALERTRNTEQPAINQTQPDIEAEHWLHLKTSNPIESTFSPVRARTRVTKGPGSKAAGLAMAFKLLEAAQDRWRAVNGPHLVALVRAGARFEQGVLVERPHIDTGTVAA